MLGAPPREALFLRLPRQQKIHFSHPQTRAPSQAVEGRIVAAPVRAKISQFHLQQGLRREVLGQPGQDPSVTPAGVQGQRRRLRLRFRQQLVQQPFRHPSQGHFGKSVLHRRHILGGRLRRSRFAPISLEDRHQLAPVALQGPVHKSPGDLVCDVLGVPTQVGRQVAGGRGSGGGKAPAQDLLCLQGTFHGQGWDGMGRSKTDGGAAGNCRLLSLENRVHFSDNL